MRVARDIFAVICSSVLWSAAPCEAIYISKDRLPSSSAPPGSAVARAPGQSLAVIMVGCKDRWLIDSKVKQVIRPSAKAGFRVDVFVSLLKAGAAYGQPWWLVNGTVPSMEATMSKKEYADAIKDAGGQLVYFDIFDKPLKVKDSFPEDRDKFKGRLEQYSPFIDETGRNVLRRYKAIEGVYKIIESTATKAGFAYDFVLLTKDDDFWAGPLDLQRFARRKNSGNTLYTKDCQTYDGFNDKTCLFGGKAAKRMLSKLYSDFWSPDSRLNTFNTEQFLMRYAEIKGVKHVSTPYAQIPSVVSVYVSQGAKNRTSICTKVVRGHEPMCGGLPDDADFNEPESCEGKTVVGR